MWLFMISHMCRLSWNALEFTALFLWAVGLIFYIINRTLHKCLEIWKWNYFSCWTGYLVCFARSWDILVNIRNRFQIPAHPCIILYVYVFAQVWKVAIHGSTSMMAIVIVFAMILGAFFGIPPQSSSFVAACLCLSSTPLVAKFISSSNIPLVEGTNKGE